MITRPSEARPIVMTLEGPEATAALAERLGGVLRSGDTLLLQGDIGAGKTHFARALIQSLQARHGAVEDVPSPTFTIVQTYHAGPLEIWHADLYRLADPSELAELGLEGALSQALTLVEWPDRLGTMTPSRALWMSFRIPPDRPEARIVEITPRGAGWERVLGALGAEAGS
ncbi:MAG: tRNA (adenosine(37)-N6)-threonylcarbamoyltransferase complex ATPase subunit type 1 TsaE [Alphaproteobacteria bacterium]|nr:MAG: tRNA (adenosine(37)-N6)-threonylcarbamoyltransferase complex ATPase subunit type 1 TsaE [Alphaproteobacteria bacterium]